MKSSTKAILIVGLTAISIPFIGFLMYAITSSNQSTPVHRQQRIEDTIQVANTEWHKGQATIQYEFDLWNRSSGRLTNYAFEVRLYDERGQVIKSGQFHPLDFKGLGAGQSSHQALSIYFPDVPLSFVATLSFKITDAEMGD